MELQLTPNWYPTETEIRHVTRPSLGSNPGLGTNARMKTGTVPRLEQLELFSGFCPVRKSAPKPKLHRDLTPREKDAPKQLCALNDPLIIEAINLFNATIGGIESGRRLT